MLGANRSLKRGLQKYQMMSIHIVEFMYIYKPDER